MRIEVEKFHLTKNCRRTVRNNNDIQVRIVSPPSVTLRKLALYKNYVHTKHGESQETEESCAPAVYGMHYGYERIIEMNYFHGDVLVGVGIVDEGEDCLSSNYFYYSTAYLERRPGIFSILKEIALAKKMRKRFYYLGFYIAGNPAMSYKKDFRPNQILENGRWTDFPP